jgi:hypothetical protein
MTELTPMEQVKLEQLEAVVDNGLRTFVEVGLALGQIADQRLYKAAYGSFEAYLRERWQLGEAYGRRLIQAARVVTVLSPIGETSGLPAPTNEAQARELVRLHQAKGNGAVLQLWKGFAAGNGPVTAKTIKEAVDLRLAGIDPARLTSDERREQIRGYQMSLVVERWLKVFRELGQLLRGDDEKDVTRIARTLVETSLTADNLEAIAARLEVVAQAMRYAADEEPDGTLTIYGDGDDSDE